MTGEEAYTLNGFGAQIAALLAREDQRAHDQVEKDQLRATLRKADERRWNDLDDRLDRVQASVEDVRHDLADSLDTRVEDAEKLRKQSDEIVARMKLDAEKVALRLHEETERVAASLGEMTLQTADILKSREEKRILGRFLSRGMRTFISIVAVVLFSCLAFALFEHRDDISGDIATGIAAMSAVLAIVYATSRKK